MAIKFEKFDPKTFEEELKISGKGPKTKQEAIKLYCEGLKVQEKLTDSLQRKQAELENTRKQYEKRILDHTKFSNSNLISKLLPILDNFELALKNKHKKDDFIQGTEMIYNEFIQTLKEIGLEKIQAQNQKFDPYLHEALLQEKSDKENIVLEELQTGYKLNDKVLRHTKVKISKR